MPSLFICRGGVQAKDKVLLRGKLEEYEQAFKAVDTGGNGKVWPEHLTQ